jgi:valine dehydrogenase (NAD+)
VSEVLARFSGHEQVVFGSDPATGLRAIVAIHSTRRGPALGGTRWRAYASEDEALADVLALSRAMSYKNALAGLDHGGGKAVLWGDPATTRSPELLHAYGRFLRSLGGRYVTAGDVGCTVADLDVIGEENPWTTGRSPERGGGGDSGVLTAYGVFQGLRACAERVWGEPTLRGRRVGVSGVGKVGARLAALLADDGASVVVADPDADAVTRLRAERPEVAAVEPDALAGLDLDAYAPCALGGALTDEVVGRLTARVVAGAANNQLAHPGVAAALAERGVLYAPDFLVNCGGVIQVADELHGFSMERARARTARVFDTTREVLALAQAEGVLPVAAAERLAEARIAEGTWHASTAAERLS